MKIFDTIMQKKEAKDIYSKALDLHKNGLYKEAEAAYRKVIDLDPSFYKAYTNLGSVLMKNLKFQEPDSDKRSLEAVQCYTMALELHPDDPVALFDLGTIHYLNFDDEEKAIVFFAQAINADSRYRQQVYAYLSWASYHPKEDFVKVIDRSNYLADKKKIPDSGSVLQLIKIIGIVLILIGIYYLLGTPICDKFGFKDAFIATILTFLATFGGFAGMYMAKTRTDTLLNGLLIILFLVVYNRVILGCYHP